MPFLANFVEERENVATMGATFCIYDWGFDTWYE